MGIENFFKSLKINKMQSKNLVNKIKPEYVYIDFNSIVHDSAHKIEKKINNYLYTYIDKIYDLGFSVKNENEAFEKEHNIEYIIAKKNDAENNRKNNTEDEKIYFLHHFESIIKTHIDDIIIKKIKETILDIIFNQIDGNSITKLFISADGIPNMAKILEQKRRKFIAYKTQIIKENIYILFKKEENSFSDETLIYEENKFTFDKTKISPVHPFMGKIKDELTNENFLNELKKNNVKEYYFSGVDFPGEGEKKIMEDILSVKPTGTILYYSPDSDVIVQSIIINNILDNGSNIITMKYNSQEKEYNYYDIANIRDKIYKQIYVGVNEKLDTKNIINDMMALYILFGNDYIPKVEAMNVPEDIAIVTNNYIEYLKKSTTSIEKKYITIFKDGKYQINDSNLKRFINILANQEQQFLANAYINQYMSYETKKIYSEGKNVDKFEFDDFSVYTDYHINNIKNLVHLNAINKDDYSIIMDYYIELYSLDNLLNNNITRWREMFNNSDTIGEVSYDTKTKKYTKNIIGDDEQKYNEIYFPNMNIDDVSKNYLDGFNWVFDFYFNKNDSKINYDNVSMWYYKYSRAPLLTTLNKYINANFYLFNGETALVKRENFLDKHEHYVYTTPKNILDEELYADANTDEAEEVNDVYDNIDCTRKKFLSKCYYYIEKYPNLDPKKIKQIEQYEKFKNYLADTTITKLWNIIKIIKNILKSPK